MAEQTPREMNPQQAALVQAAGTGVAPAGYKRDEQQAVAKDALAEEAERLAGARQAYRIRADAFDEDREVQAQIQRSVRSGVEDFLAGENLDTAYFYYRAIQCAFPRDTPGKQFVQAKGDGFSAVRGDELSLENGRPIITTRNVYANNANFDNALQVGGDLVLMRMERYRANAWLGAQEQFSRELQHSRQNPIIDGDPSRGMVVRTDPNDPKFQQYFGARMEPTIMAPTPTVASAALMQQARNIATNQLADQMRTGTVRGAEVR